VRSPTVPSDLLDIPGIGKTFVADFARIGIHQQSDLKGKCAQTVYSILARANASDDHATSKNYLYVLRMAIYYADGGRDPARLKWHAWTDRALEEGR
jgi:Pathogenicity locus